MSDTDLIRGWLVCGSTDHWNYPKRVCQECLEAKEALAALARVEADMAVMREALAWYAEQRNYRQASGDLCAEHGGSFCTVFHQDTYDNDEGLPGARARIALAAVSDVETRIEEDTALRILADMVCGSPSPGNEELFCALRLGHEGSHAGMTLDGLACEWRRSPKHRAETASTHCRFCGAHPDYWHLPCSDGETL